MITEKVVILVGNCHSIFNSKLRMQCSANTSRVIVLEQWGEWLNEDWYCTRQCTVHLHHLQKIVTGDKTLYFLYKWQKCIMGRQYESGKNDLGGVNKIHSHKNMFAFLHNIYFC